MAKRGNPTQRARAGNYAADIDPNGLDPSMAGTLFGTKMDKTESDYVAQAGNKATATEAVRRARKANKKPPLQEEV